MIFDYINSKLAVDVSDKFTAVSGRTLNIRAVRIGNCIIATGNCNFGGFLSGEQSLFTVADDIIPYMGFSFSVFCVTDQSVTAFGTGYYWGINKTMYARGMGTTSGVNFSFGYITK